MCWAKLKKVVADESCIPTDPEPHPESREDGEGSD